jgi:UDP-glucuronate 4-epimerase
VTLLHFIEVLEQAIGITANKRLLPLQPGDVLETYADIADLTAAVGYVPKTPIEIGIPRFVDWYLQYYGQLSSSDRTTAFSRLANARVV